MRELLIVVALILLASLVLNGYFIWDRAQAQKERFADNSKLNQVIESKTAEILTLDRAVFKKDSLRKVDSLKFRVSEMGLKIEIKTYRSTIAKLRPQVQAKIDSFPDLRQFVELQDSIITKQDSLIRSQELFCQLQVTDLKEIINMTQQKYEAQVQISKLWEQSAVEYEQESNKLRKRAKFKNLIIYVLGGGVLWMAVKE